MPNVFDSARLTLRRAKFHIDNFNSVIRDFIDRQPWAYVVDRDSKLGEEIHKVVFTSELPEFLPCILFDAASNLRAVLDQAGYAAAVASGKLKPKKCKFPFGDSCAAITLHGGKPDSNYQDLPKEIFDFFMTFQPYKGGNDRLWAMNKLCNTKKHCKLTTIGLSNAFANFIASVPDGTKIGRSVDEQGKIRGWDSERREMTLVTVPTGIDPHILGNFTFDIELGEFEPFAGQHATSVINTMSAVTERILAGTEAECRRLGFIS
jgi:hypothetical protein